MAKHACMSNVRDPENRSKKDCVCGGHSQKARKKKRKRGRREFKDFIEKWFKCPVCENKLSMADVVLEKCSWCEAVLK